MKVKVCDRYNFAQVYAADGSVRLCSWARNKELGSLCEHTMEELWQSEKARAFRQSIRDGSFKNCMEHKEECPYLSSGTMDQHSIEIDTDNEPSLPECISLSYDRSCNYQCTVCYRHENDSARLLKKNVGVIEERLKPILSRVKIISANGMGEMFASPSIMKLLHDWKPEGPADEIKVILETNGSMFDEKHWEQISNLGQYHLEVAVTIMSFDESTYHYLSGTKLPISKLIESLKFIKKLREQNIINHLSLSTVVQEANFRTLPEFTRRCLEEFGADIVGLRPFFPQSPQPRYVEWFMDIRNPHHPYYQEYLEVMKHPIFSHPKVYKWSGEIESPIGPFIDFVSQSTPNKAWTDDSRKLLENKLDEIRISTKAYREYFGNRIRELFEFGERPLSMDVICEEFEKNGKALETVLGAEDYDKLFRAFRQRADMQYVDDSIQEMRRQYPHIVIMGNGGYGKRLAKQLSNCGFDFDGFAVSDDRNPPKETMCKPVWRLSDLPFNKEKLGIVVAVRHELYQEIRGNLECKGLNYIYPYEVF